MREPLNRGPLNIGGAASVPIEALYQSWKVVGHHRKVTLTIAWL